MMLWLIMVLLSVSTAERIPEEELELLLGEMYRDTERRLSGARDAVGFSFSYQMNLFGKAWEFAFSTSGVRVSGPTKIESYGSFHWGDVESSGTAQFDTDIDMINTTVEYGRVRLSAFGRSWETSAVVRMPKLTANLGVQMDKLPNSCYSISASLKSLSGDYELAAGKPGSWLSYVVSTLVRLTHFVEVTRLVTLPNIEGVTKALVPDVKNDIDKAFDDYEEPCPFG